MRARTRRFGTVLAATAIAVGVTIGLSGCFNPLETFVKSATKGQVDLAGNAVPASFPKSIPLYPGKVTSGVQMGQDNDNIWNVIMVVPGPSVMDTIAKQLRGAGFTTDLSTETEADRRTLIFDNAKYDVAVVLKKTANGYTVDYAVSNQTEDDQG